jgi:hypothetical protein
MSKYKYVELVNYFNTVSGFKIHNREDNDSDAYDDLLSYTSRIESIIPDAIHYESILKQGYCDDFLEKKLGELVLEINQKTLCIV